MSTLKPLYPDLFWKTLFCDIMYTEEKHVLLFNASLFF